MAVSAQFLEQAKELFAPFGEIRIRRMFGGAGVYCDDLFFALIDDDVVYLKADEATRGEFEGRGLSAFSYETKNGVVTGMSYYAAPDDLFDDETALRRWARLALDAARRAAKFRKKPKRRAAR
jgi:DNA transformation protein